MAGAWANTTVGGVAMGDAFKRWYFSTNPAAGGHRSIEDCTGNDGSCGVGNHCGA